MFELKLIDICSVVILLWKGRRQTSRIALNNLKNLQILIIVCKERSRQLSNSIRLVDYNIENIQIDSISKSIYILFIL